MIKPQVAADIMSGATVRLRMVQAADPVDREMEWQISGVIAALGIVLGVDLRQYGYPDEWCADLEESFEIMRHDGEAIRRQAGANG